MIDLYQKGLAKFDWWQDWRDQCVAIVAAGPSAKNAGVEKLRDRIHVVAVNESYRLCPWADMLYSCDWEWWDLRKKEINGFAGIKLCFTSPKDLKLNKIVVAKEKKRDEWLDDFLFEEPGVVGSGGHSGYQALNIVAQLGATGIALIGFDMNMVGGLHWHGRHPDKLRNPDDFRLIRWREDMDKNAPKLAAAGIDVVNCSPTSSLKSFPKLTIDEALERWGL